MTPVESIVIYKLYKDVRLNQDNLDAAGIDMSANEAIILMVQVDDEVQETLKTVYLKRKRYVYKRIQGKMKRVSA